MRPFRSLSLVLAAGVILGLVVAPIATGAEVVETTRVSFGDLEANGDSHNPAVSGDGSTIVYTSEASNLVADDTNNHQDIFAYNIATGTTTRISVASNGTEANGDSRNPAVSGDGSTIVYTSSASNLVTGDDFGREDVFAYKAATGTTTRITVGFDGTEANFDSRNPAVSGSGSVIVYESRARNLVRGDTNETTDVFAYDAATDSTIRVSVAPDGTERGGSSHRAAVSGDGSTVVYDSNGVFAYDLPTAITTSVSVAGWAAVVPHDGSLVVYSSFASDLVAGNVVGDVFAYDVTSATTSRISVASGGGQASGDSRHPSVSDDGSVIAYSSSASDLVVGDANGTWDVFMTRVTPIGSNPFDDDDASVFEADIEWLADAGITNGCGHRLFCPDDVVTRGQMAAFLVRALNLTDAGSGDLFDDDDGSIFETSIDKLATAGITNGCNPPVNDMFCPLDPVTRGQMAAFLVRAMGYTDSGGGNLFEDDDGSIFESAIDKLATAGVTRGCNPSGGNTRFCPNSNVTRSQMAAFLHRALG